MQNYNLPTVNHGNTFGGVNFTLPTDPLYDLTGATIKIQVRKNFNHEIVKEYAAGTGLTITLPHTIEFAPHIVTLPAAVYKWDLKIVFADGRAKTYIGGEWTVNAVITL